ncbi:MAG: hypothetical protein IJ619_06290 [Eubacterium sp.]|nr:hypothetical protein [Eubacterium sp.]
MVDRVRIQMSRLRYIKTFAGLFICISFIFALSACTHVEDKVPVVTCSENEISVNGKVVGRADGRVCVNRMDSSVVSLSVGSTVTKDGRLNIVNVDSDGNEIKLSDVITDSALYESEIVNELNRPRILVRDSIDIRPEVDREAMEKVLLSYDEAMKLPFIMGEKGVTIIYTEENGASYTVSFDYGSALIASRFVPKGGMMCTDWMIGRVGTGVSGMVKEEYSDHWAEDSIQIENYNGQTYYWFCVAYIDDEDNRTYYSVVAEKTDDGRKVIYSQQVDGPFVCCDLEEFARILEGSR